MSLNKPQLNALVALLSESLRARSGEVLTDLVIAERARNAALLLNVSYAMSPVSEGNDEVNVSNGLRAGVLTRTERDRVSAMLGRLHHLEGRLKSEDASSRPPTSGEANFRNRMRAEAAALRWAIEIITGVDPRLAAPPVSTDGART